MKKQILVNSQWLKVIRETARFPDGTVINDFYTVERPAYAAVIPLFNDQKIMLVQQYRHGPRQVILNLPMGVIAKKEKPVDTAHRELIEEIGYNSGDISFLGTFQNNPAFLRLTCHLFLARKLKRMITHETDTNERTAVIHLTLEEALKKILLGEIQDMTTVIGISMTYLKTKKIRFQK